ncbi:putative bifunctional diguanylate cyclase/phosphodiesterase [Aureimonas ureilytica]|uniref:putative bifunctional diguanylate cyclase/phosphodiesterase n=1 Tax=Aureimonas ureilytica TaxID=401562 RepID=UPI000733D6E2|nr:EAL domain-containing protein [Aureimonas ureilytica]
MPASDTTTPLAASKASAGTEIDFAALSRRVETGLWVYDFDAGRIIWANGPGLDIWNAATLTELSQRDLLSDMSVSVKRRLAQYLQDFIAKDAVFSEFWTVYPGGIPRPLQVRFSGLRLGDGRMALLCEGRIAEMHEHEALRRADALIHTQVMISLYNRAGKALYSNPAASRAFAGVDGDLCRRFVHRRDYTSLLDALERAGEANQIAQIHTEGGRRWHEMTARFCHDPASGQPSILISETDVSRLKEEEERASKIAYTDALTGLPNRLALAPIFERMMDGARVRDRHFGILFIDLDHFKAVNDTLGHAFGDMLLKEMACRLSRLCRRGDHVVRLGGDEFLFFAAFRGRGDQRLHKLSGDIIASLSEPVLCEERVMAVTPSIGIALYPQHGADMPRLMQGADLALYAAKGSGRNGFCFFSSEMRAASEEKHALATDLKRAMAQGEFEVHYQPRLRARDLVPVGAEALVRWRHPARGLVPPGQFIALCEEIGLIGELGRFVLGEALRQQGEWREAGYRISMSVNISLRELCDPDFAQEVAVALAASGCRGPELELELTETLFLDDSAPVRANMELLRAMGVRISIDDFGTGYSNFARLHEMSVDCIKIDRSFVRALPKNRALTEAVISMARLMKARIVVEGIETEEQAAWVRRFDCDEIQGFLFGRPIPPAEFIAGLQISKTTPEEELRRIIFG